MPAAPVAVRPGRRDDLDAAVDVWYTTELAEEPDGPSPTFGGEVFLHDLRTGDLMVAERGGEVVGFASSFPREGVRFLSNLFVRPDAQSGGIGGRLLEAAMPADGRIHCTMSSRDPRAVALYARHGMAPRQPHPLLGARADRIDFPPGEEVTVVPALWEDPELVRWDAEISGRHRPEDLAHLVHDMAAEAFWFERSGRPVGYGFVQPRSTLSLRHADRATVGPVGVADAADAAACVRAAVRLAAERSAAIGIGVLGPHPALPELLRAGFRIEYVELFMASREFVDPGRYVASGSEVF